MATCKIEGCQNKRGTRGWCEKHYRRWLVHGDPFAMHRRANGEGRINDGGYRVLWSKERQKHILEHRLVMEDYLGRPLRNNERIHHKNGNRLDNRVENLELFVSGHVPGQRVEDLVAWAREILELYEVELERLNGNN